MKLNRDFMSYTTSEQIYAEYFFGHSKYQKIQCTHKFELC